jgi:hypothetical protein
LLAKNILPGKFIMNPLSGGGGMNFLHFYRRAKFFHKAIHQKRKKKSAEVLGVFQQQLSFYFLKGDI